LDKIQQNKKRKVNKVKNFIMSNINNIFARLEKADKAQETKLASHKVELALRDDIIGGFQKYLGQRDAAAKAISKAEDAVINAYNNYAALAGAANATLGDLNTLKTKAKELGIDLDPDMTGIEKKMKDELKVLKPNAAAIQNTAKGLSAIRMSIK
jgi:hypothetical protein